MNKDKSAKGKTSMRKGLSRLITIVCIAVFVYAAYGLYNTFMEYYQNRQVLSVAQEIYYQPVADEDAVSGDGVSQAKSETKEGAEASTGGSQGSQGSLSSEIRPQFKELQEINSDIVGWIAIDDTPINYPILQSDNNNDYLQLNYNEEQSIAGSIFMDYRNDITSPSPNTIIYGHRMKDGSMFNSLKKFLDKDFFDQHKTIKFDTLYGSYDAEVFAVYNTTTDFDYIQTDFNSDEEYQQLLSDIEGKSKHHTGTEINADDQIITLSTCDYLLDPDKGRLVVHAKIVKKG